MGIIRVRIPNLILAAVFMGAGFSALFGQPQVREAFYAWGYPDWFRTAIGLVQATAGGCLLIPRAVPAAAAILSAIMLGAIGTHVRAGEYPFALIPLAALVALVYVGLTAWRNRPTP